MNSFEWYDPAPGWELLREVRTNTYLSRCLTCNEPQSERIRHIKWLRSHRLCRECKNNADFNATLEHLSRIGYQVLSIIDRRSKNPKVELKCHCGQVSIVNPYNKKRSPTCKSCTTTGPDPYARVGGVYCLTTIDDPHPLYIGETDNVRRRLQAHNRTPPAGTEGWNTARVYEFDGHDFAIVPLKTLGTKRTARKWLEAQLIGSLNTANSLTPRMCGKYRAAANSQPDLSLSWCSWGATNNAEFMTIVPTAITVRSFSTGAAQHLDFRRLDRCEVCVQ